MAPLPLPSTSNILEIIPHAALPSTPNFIRRFLPSIPKALQVRSYHQSPSIRSSLRRQTIVAIPATYSGLNAGPDSGTVVGIVLGSVAGFLLILWLLYTCFNLGGGGGGGARSVVVEEEIVRRRSRSPRRQRSVSRSEVIEVRSPPRREPSRRETIVVEETRRPASREEEDDIVEVIEEHSPPRRVRSQRASGYRTVDPEAFGGGGRPLRKVGRR